MRKFIIYTLIFTLITNFSFAQQTTKENKLSRQEYLQKSKNQKTFAWILLGAGAVSIVSVSSGKSSFNSTAAFAILGGISVISSIPLFIASSRNKRKGMAISVYLNFDRTSSYQFAFKDAPMIPSLKLKINL